MSTYLNIKLSRSMTRTSKALMIVGAATPRIKVEAILLLKKVTLKRIASKRASLKWINAAICVNGTTTTFRHIIIDLFVTIFLDPIVDGISVNKLDI